MNRGFVAFALAMSATGCLGDARHARVELDLQTVPCPPDRADRCTVHLVGSGLIFTADAESSEAAPGTDTLYAEVETASGALALIEIVTLRSGVRKVRYREVMDNGVAYRGVISDRFVKIPERGPWQFSFEAARATETAPTRIVTDGRVIPVDEDRVNAVETTAPTRRRPSRDEPPPEPAVVVVYDDSGGCDDIDDHEPRDPDIDPPSDIDRRGEAPDVPDDPYLDDDSSGGCDTETDPDYDAGGCDGGDTDSGGCEGDTADEVDTSGCDSCEGDTVASISPERRRRRAMRSVLRLAWPVFIAGWFNRKRRQGIVMSPDDV